LFRQADWVGFKTRKKWIENIKKIKDVGIDRWFGEQTEKQALLEEALQYFNNSRMRSFFCLSFLYFEIDTIKKLVAATHAQKKLELKERSAAIQQAIKAEAQRHNLKIWDD